MDRKRGDATFRSDVDDATDPTAVLRESERRTSWPYPGDGVLFRREDSDEMETVEPGRACAGAGAGAGEEMSISGVACSCPWAFLGPSCSASSLSEIVFITSSSGAAARGVLEQDSDDGDVGREPEDGAFAVSSE